MSVTYNGPVRVYKRRNPTNDGTAQTNSVTGLMLGDNTGASVVSQEYIVYIPTLSNSNLNVSIYEAGVGGARFDSTGNIVTSSLTTPSILTLPAGARIQGVNLNVITAPTTVTAANFVVNMRNIVTIAIIPLSTSVGNTQATLNPVLTAVQRIANVGSQDVHMSVDVSGTTLTGAILAEFSITYTVRNADGSIISYGSGATNDGTNAPTF